MKDCIAPNPCPKCGDPIPAEAAQGLCPRCLLTAVAAATEGGPPAGERLSPPSTDTLTNLFPQLEILELIGTGGMGSVYKARQPRLDRLVALKLLAPALAGSFQFAQRFHREARLLARLHHSGIVSVYDYGEAGECFFLLMEFVDGVNLRQAMQAGRFTPAQALALVPRICEALQYAHDEGILHRDIKPENILLDTRGRVKIADFGIAKLLGDKTNDAMLTGSGLAVGTPHYMAPEQLEHPQDVDQRADIYSLGVVFYEMLTGELPIGRFAPPSQKTPVDPRVDEIVLRALQKERERRQRNVTEIQSGVEQITGTAPSPLTPPVSSAPAPKTSLCYVSTPEYLRTLRGRFLYIYQGNGLLRLDDRTLNFSSGWHSVTIPLTSIRSLARGEHSLAAKPIPLHYIEVVFEDHGTPRTLLFTPTRSGLLPAWETNKDVAEWINAVQSAAEKASGRPLPLSQSSGTGRGWGKLVKSLGLTVLICSLIFLAIPIVVEKRLPNRWTDYLPGPLLAVISLGLGLSLRAWTERRASWQGNLDELTQEFFSRLLANPRLGGVEPGRGRFRSYLLGAVKHFLGQERQRAAAAKRGGGHVPLSLDAATGADTTSELQIPHPTASVPDTWFDRHWATTLVDRAVATLEAEAEAEGKGGQFCLLKPWLQGEVPSLSQAEAACQLGLTEGAVKVAVHRLRKRFRDVVKDQIAQTVDDSSQVREELRYLVDVLVQAPIGH